ncbi:histone-lysine N-methyltransferase SMYD3-like [Mucor ambiguus]|uniref:Histone-lysine N-methyltransferase SMYD3-like n=1 Tax=Mucor ambiguus TaxID=91626 RepID=A0A0C9MUT3_9FUNG|nr:histone-lysine N-methyltransferase SMYD3-like [Mucor ambiguus]
MQQQGTDQSSTPSRDIQASKGKWNKVTEKKEEGKGTFCVAKEKINQGEQLLTEQPFMRQIDEKYKKTRCHYCFGELDDATSRSCRDKDCQWKTKYCSEDCERQAWTNGHQWLCRFPELSKQDTDIIFAVQGYFVSKSQNQDILPDLVSNRNSFDASHIKDYRDKLAQAAAILDLTDSAIDNIITILFQIKCNAFAVKTAQSVDVDATFVVSREFLTLGRAIYLSASKVNHDCDPNAIVSFGDGAKNLCQLKIQCVKGPIEKGNEITISYGPLASVHSKEDRLKKLKEGYQFECKCSACKDTSNKKSPESIYKCQICKKGRLYRQQSKCGECGQEPHWPYFIKTESEVEVLKRKQDFIKVFKLQSDIYHDDTLVLGQTADRVAMYACNSGQWEVASNYAIMSLTVARKVYGKLSVEAAEEMMKLSTILLNLCLTTGKRKKEAIAHIKGTIITYKILGLDKTMPEDIDELEQMMTHLMFMAL